MKLRRLLLLVPALLALAPLASARAAAEPDQGWWNSANTNGTTLPAADVPADGLFVAGAQTDAITTQLPGAVTGVIPTVPVPATGRSVAAVRFPLVDGELPSTLTLTIASTTPVTSTAIQACRARTDFKPVYNGQGVDAPESDCSLNVTGTLAADSKSITWSGLDRLGDGDHVSLVLVPSASDRVSFAHATGAALVTIPGAPPLVEETPAVDTAPVADTPTVDAPAGAVPSTIIGGDVPAPASGPSTDAGSISTPATTTVDTAPTEVAAGTALPTKPTRFVPAVIADSSRTRAVAILLLLVAVAAYGAMELQRGDRRPRLIGPLAGTDDAPATGVAVRERGVGRFRSARPSVAPGGPMPATGPRERGVGRFKTLRPTAKPPAGL